MDNETPLAGGNVTPVTRLGAVVHREAGPWTPTVHALLRHLRANGFRQAPEPLGFDAQGREMLTFIEGVAGFFSVDRT